MEKSIQALKICAEWLVACLKIGWEKKDLDDLERLWWKYHDYRTGAPKKCHSSEQDRA